MPNEIDSLSIKITANATQAANSIDKLATSLGNLGKQLGPDTVKNLGNMSTAISSIASTGTESSVTSITNLATAISKLSGAASAINEFRSAIGGLSSSLERFYEKGSRSAEYLSNITTSFGNLTEKLNTIDSSKILELSESLKGFASSTKQINTILGQISFTDIGLNAKRVTNTVDEMTKTIASQWGIIGKEAQEELRGALLELANATRMTNIKDVSEGSDAVVNAFWKVSDAIRNNARIADESKSVYKDLLDWIARTNASGAKVHLPFNGEAEFRDAYKSMRATLGRAFTQKPAFRDIADYAAEMNEVLHTTFDLGTNAESIFKQIYDAVVDARNATMSYDEALRQGAVGVGEIEAAANDLIGAINNLKVQGGGVENVFKVLAEGLQQLSGLNIPDSSNLAQLVTAISSFGHQAASQAPANITAITNALLGMLNSLSQTTVASSGVSSLVQSLSNLVSSLGSFNASANAATSGINNLNNAAQRAGSTTVPALQQMTSTVVTASAHGLKIPALIGKIVSALSKLNIIDKIAVSVKNLSMAMAALVRNMAARTVSVITTVSNKLNFFGQISNIVSTRTNKLASTIGMLYAKFWLLRRVCGWLKSAIDASSDLVETQHIIDVTFGDASGKIEAFAKTSIQSLGMSELSVKRLASRYQSMGTALGYGNKEMANYSIEMTRLAGNMASFYNRSYEETGKALESIFTGQTKPLILAA